jgi:hypothetical protein
MYLDNIFSSDIASIRRKPERKKRFLKDKYEQESNEPRAILKRPKSKDECTKPSE